MPFRLFSLLKQDGRFPLIREALPLSLSIQASQTALELSDLPAFLGFRPRKLAPKLCGRALPVDPLLPETCGLTFSAAKFLFLGFHGLCVPLEFCALARKLVM